MPLYDYECPDCGAETECFFKLDEAKDRIECACCYSTMSKVIRLGHGGIKSEWPTWINDEVRGSLQDETEKPIETRTDLNRVIKEKNLVAVG
jgi:putative FmdB family regulatory protein